MSNNQYPLPTNGIGVATNAVLTGTGVVQTPAVLLQGKWPGPNQYSLQMVLGSTAQVTCLPVDTQGTPVNPTNISAPTTGPATQQATHLGTAGNFGVLAQASVVGSAGAGSVVSGGDVGLYPGTAISNFPPSRVTPPNVIHDTDAVAQQGQNDLTTAINYYNGLTPTLTGLSNLSTGGNGVNNSTYTAGVYQSAPASSLDIPTSITLDAQGNPAAVFVFLAGSTITLESGASVILANGAQAGNVYWVAGSSFTSVWNGIQSNMVGTIMTVASITLGGGNLNGRALAQVSVTMATTEIITVPVLLAIPGVTIPGVTIPFGVNAITLGAAPAVGTSGNITAPSWYNPKSQPLYSNPYMASAVVDDNDSNPWTVRARKPGQTVIQFMIPTFENNTGNVLSDSGNNQMDETPIDSVFALLTVTVINGATVPASSGFASQIGGN